MFFAQYFGDVVGTYEGCLPLSESIWGYDSTWRWWGHLTTILHNLTRSNLGSQKIEFSVALSLAPRRSEIYEAMLIAREREREREWHILFLLFITGMIFVCRMDPSELRDPAPMAGFTLWSTSLDQKMVRELDSTTMEHWLKVTHLNIHVQYHRGMEGLLLAGITLIMPGGVVQWKWIIWFYPTRPWLMKKLQGWVPTNNVHVSSRLKGLCIILLLKLNGKTNN